MSRCKLILLAVLAWVVLATPSFAASSNVNSLTASGNIVGTQLFYCPIGASTDLKCTAAQIAAYTYSLMSGSCTATSGGVITCSGSGVTSFSYSCPTTGPLTGAVTLPLGIGEIPESSAFSPTAAQCGAWFDVTGTTTVTLPAITGSIVSPYFITIKDADTSGNTVTVNPTGATINYNGSSASSITLSPGQSIGLVVNAANTAWQATGTVTGTPYNSPLVGRGYKASVNYVPYFTSAPGTTAAIAGTTTMACIPGEIGNISAAGGGSGSMGGISLRAGTVGTTSYQFGLYANDTAPSGGGPYRPGALLGITVQEPNTSLANETAAFSSAIAGLTPDIYWFCLEAGDTTFKYFQTITTAANYSGYSQLIGTTSVSNSVFPAPTGLTTTVASYGTFPSSLHGATFTEAIGTNIPFISFYFASIP